MLDLDYQPIKLVSTEGMSEKEWLSWRKQGLGGSDTAVVMGCSPWKTKRDLYYDKAGIPNAIPDTSNWVAKEIGHRLEGLVADLFAQKTGYTVSEEKYMFQHPLYPFMLANVDRFIELPDGKRAILEIKTTHYLNKASWEHDRIPRYYELQGRFYMAVLNLDVCFFACLFGNNETDLIMHRIERDLDEEEILINELQHFWQNNVLAKVEPPLLEKPELALETLKRHFGSDEKNTSQVSLPANYMDTLMHYLDIKEQKAALEKKARQLDKEMKAAYLPIIEFMGAHSSAVLVSGNTEYQISYEIKQKQTLTAEQCKLLQLKYPHIFEEMAVTTETRPFKVTVVPTIAPAKSA